MHIFSPCTAMETREVICLELNILTEAITDKYLGLLRRLEWTDQIVLLTLLIGSVKG
jgi:hypothetical protein